MRDLNSLFRGELAVEDRARYIFGGHGVITLEQDNSGVKVHFTYNTNIPFKTFYNVLNG
jgi:hypothetical protein